MKYIMQENGFCQGIEIKREPTWEETLYCLEEILSFDVNYVLELDKQPDDDFFDGDDELKDDYYEEISNEKQCIQETFVDFIQGKATWNALCDRLYCYDAIEADLTIGIFAYLIKYLQEKEII